MNQKHRGGALARWSLAGLLLASACSADRNTGSAGWEFSENSEAARDADHDCNLTWNVEEMITDAGVRDLGAEYTLCDGPGYIYARELVELRGCHWFRGGIALDSHGDPEISDVDVTALFTDLSSLRVIEGAIVSTRNSELRTLQGLENVEWVGHNLLVRGSPELRSIEQLGKVTYVGRALGIELGSLESLRGLECLQRVEGSASLVGSFDSFEPLRRLEYIGGGLRIIALNMNRDEVDRLLDRVEVGGEVKFNYEVIREGP